MLKKIVFCFFIITYLFSSSLTASFVYAQEKHFSYSLKTTYTVNESGTTYVEHNIKIKNLTPEYHITDYGLKLSSPNISNIAVTSNSKKIDSENITTGNQTSIGISFPDEVLGENKERKFIITYQNPDLALISGKVLEVSIPQMANEGDYDEHHVSLITQKNYGQPKRVSVENYQSSQQNGQIVTSFATTGDQGISVIFGEQQIFDLTLRYHLRNPNGQLAITQVSLPPDTPYQKMHYHHIDPLPEKIELDNDGNWIATYKLAAGNTTEVIIQAQALITLKPLNTVYETIPNQKHTKALKFWESDKSKIISIANEHQSAKGIYQFVTEELNYDLGNLENLQLDRLGGSTALKKSDTATCQEFTDLFITLARAKQIPARRITGYAYSQNSTLRPLSLVTDILHAWPEYYNLETKKWVPIDPTWGHTTGGIDYFSQFDLNHVVFAINGESSTIPYPAGAYKVEETDTKDVEVKFGEEFPQITESIQINLIPKQLSTLTMPGFYQLEIANQTGQAWYNLNLEFFTNDENSKIQIKKQRIDALLPYQKIYLPLTIYNDKEILPQQDKISIKISNQNYESEIRTASKISRFIYNPYTILGVGIGGIVLTLVTGSILVFRRKK